MLIISIVLFLSSVFVYTTPVMADFKSPLNAGNLFVVSGSLFIVIAIIVIIYLIVKAKFKVQNSSPFQISIVNRINLDSKHQIVLLKIDENYLLVGVGDISLIKEIRTKEGIDFSAAVAKFKGNDKTD